jgi:DNA mismatch endonuclease (patch repair protein)
MNRAALAQEVSEGSLTLSDTHSPAMRSERMRRVRARNTQPELVVRRLFHGMGYRYRLHAKELPGRPDIVFRRRKLAIFVQGCFWHRHPDPECQLARLPKSRLDFWPPKLEGNRARDVGNLERLEAAGWRVLLVWECQLKDREQLGNKLRRFVEGEE